MKHVKPTRHVDCNVALTTSAPVSPHPSSSHCLRPPCSLSLDDHEKETKLVDGENGALTAYAHDILALANFMCEPRVALGQRRLLLVHNLLRAMRHGVRDTHDFPERLQGENSKRGADCPLGQYVRERPGH